MDILEGISMMLKSVVSDRGNDYSNSVNPGIKKEASMGDQLGIFEEIDKQIKKGDYVPLPGEGLAEIKPL